MNPTSQLIAANLRRYRSACDLSQQDVASAAGISRVGYRNIEAGSSTPRSGTLQRIAKALGVSIQQLLVPTQVLTHVRFRAEKRMITRENVLADVARRLGDFRELEDLLATHKPWRLAEVAQRSQLISNDRAARTAALARVALGLREEIIHDICYLLDSNGIKVLTTDVKSEGFFGLSVSQIDVGPAIVVNTWDRISVERWIFTVAHELGHLLLHPTAYDVSVIEEFQEEEREADRFASHFLMPPSLFQMEWNKAHGLGLVERTLKVKRIFRVSYQTVLARVAALLPARERRVLWQRFHELYTRQHGHSLSCVEEPEGRPASRAADEPAHLDRHDFSSDRLPRLVRQAVEGNHITVSRAAEIFGVKLGLIRKIVASW